MAITIAKLSTVSTLDSTKFSAGLAKMRTDIGAFSAISLGAFSRIGGMITDFTARAVRALPRMVLSSLQAGDALNELASQLGFSADALANLQRVAGLSGIDIGGLETSLGKLNQTLGEAMGGNKAAVKSFADLGLGIAALGSKRPEDVFFAVLDAMKEIPGTARRSAAAVDLFGRSGRSMLKLIGLGSRGIGAEMENTRRLGIAMRPADLASMERASDTLDDLKNNFKGFGDQLAIRLAKNITAVGETLLDFSKNTNLAGNAAEYFARHLQTSALTIAGILDDPWFGGAERKKQELEKVENLRRLGKLPADYTIDLTGRGRSQEELFRAFERANQGPASASEPQATRRRSSLGWNPSGRGPKEMKRRADAATSLSQRVDFLYSEVARVTDDISKRQPTGNSLLGTGQGSTAQEKYLKEILAELKQLNKKSGGGAAP